MLLVLHHYYIILQRFSLLNQFVIHSTQSTGILTLTYLKVYQNRLSLGLVKNTNKSSNGVSGFSTKIQLKTRTELMF